MLHLPELPPGTPTLSDLTRALPRLDANTQPRFGTMNAAQMLEHARRFHALCLNEIRPPFAIRLVARLIGPPLLRKWLRTPATETPRNLRTLPVLVVTEASDFAATRDAFERSIDALDCVQDGHRHPLYGSMLAKDIQALARFHTTYHFHQFGLLETPPELAKT